MCVVSHELLNLYSEGILRELGDLPGTTLGGYNPKNIRHVDDIVFIAVARTFCIHPVQGPKATRVRWLQRHSL